MAEAPSDSISFLSKLSFKTFIYLFLDKAFPMFIAPSFYNELSQKFKRTNYKNLFLLKDSSIFFPPSWVILLDYTDKSKCCI